MTKNGDTSREVVEGGSVCVFLRRGLSSHKASQVEQEIRGGDRCLGCLLIGQETIDVVFYKVLLKRTLDHRLLKLS